MAVNRARKAWIKDWLGLQTFATAKNLPPGWWTASNNCVVTNDGSAAALRSPANLNTALSTGNVVLSAFDYDKSTGDLILFDIDLGGGGATVATYSTTGTSNTSVRTGQADGARWKRLTINDMAYGTNGTEFIQTNGTNNYSVGITPPAAAPTLSFVAGGSGSFAVGVTVSYAYRNSTTKHVSAPSAASTASGASTNTTLRVAVIASGQTGVDGIVLFITEDGGSVRYLYVDTAGAPVVSANSSANIDISINSVLLDTLTPEPAYNTVAPTGHFFMFKWGDRLCLCDFRGATTRQQIQYNVFENCYYGIPWESWYPNNIINIPSKSDSARAGIETAIGALILGERDSYLIRGSLTDKIAGPQQSISITEHIQPLGWSIGTRSPYTVVTTPFGKMWLDQNKRIQIWAEDSGSPVEVGISIRTSLDAIQDSSAARNMAEATWFQHGKDGGHYVLTASTTGSTNNQLFIVTVYRDPETGQLRWACSLSDIAAQCIFTAILSGDNRCFIGITDRLREILALDTAGAGWSAGQAPTFTTILGNDDEWNYWHSLRFTVTSATGLVVSVSDPDGSNSQVVEIQQDTEGGDYFGLIDSYGFRKLVTFSFSTDDTTKRIVNNLRVITSPKQRVI